MKPVSRIIAAGVLGFVSLFAGASAQAEDMDACRGGYSMLLMTPSECRTYLKQLKDAHAKSDKMAVLELREWHDELLIQRAETCPCLRYEPKVFSRTTERR